MITKRIYLINENSCSHNDVRLDKIKYTIPYPKIQLL